jgi:hypothetical protein
MFSCSNRLILNRSQLINTTRQRLHHSIIIRPKEERDGVSHFALFVVGSVDGAKEQVVRPHTHRIAYIHDEGARYRIRRDPVPVFGKYFERFDVVLKENGEAWLL